ncbi:RNase III domain-containing protein [Plasmodiophora brassicae]|nr:hypothetical protein PBRA_008712 [Plasmodiophora brassicae]
MTMRVRWVGMARAFSGKPSVLEQIGLGHLLTKEKPKPAREHKKKRAQNEAGHGEAQDVAKGAGMETLRGMMMQHCQDVSPGVSRAANSGPTVLGGLGLGHLLQRPATKVAVKPSSDEPLPKFQPGSVQRPEFQVAEYRLPATLPLRKGYLGDLAKFLAGHGLHDCTVDVVAQALIHPSFVDVDWIKDATLPLKLHTLAFVGDALLDFLIASFSVQTLQNVSEASLHKNQFSMTNNSVLSRAAIATQIGLKPFLVVSSRKPLIDEAMQRFQADALEAFLGAIYLDQGLDAVSRFFHQRLLPALWDNREDSYYVDPISWVQTVCQRKHQCLPAYRVLDECADERDRLNRFRVGLFIRDDLVAEATAGSIAEARRLAALLTMKRVGERPDTLLLPDQIRSD